MAVPTVDSSSVVLLNQVVPYSTVILRVSVDMEEKFYVLVCVMALKEKSPLKIKV